MKIRSLEQKRLQLNPPLLIEPRAAGPQSLNVAGLFAGIGGLELGLDRAGHSTSVLCELDPGANAVLDSRFNTVSARHRDIAKMRCLPKQVEMVVAGFPCQDLSQAGRVAGIGGPQSGLIGHVFDLLQKQRRGSRVPWVVLENVPFMLQLDRGEALRHVLHELESLQYHWAYRIVDTRAFGLPQRRERVFIVASLTEDPRTVLFSDEAGEPEDDEGTLGETAFGFYWTEGTRGVGWAVNAVPTLKGGSTVGIPSPPAVWMPDGAITRPGITDAERLQGFSRNWTLPAEPVVGRRRRWKLVGNAVSVPVAKWLGDRLRAPRPVLIADYWELKQNSPWPRAGWFVGKGRWGAALSSWPVRHKRKPLATFFMDPEPLSKRATTGFLRRARASTLRFRPGFLDALEAYLDRLTPAG